MGAVVSDPNGLTWAATLVPLAVTIPTAGHTVIFKRDPRSATLWVLLIALLPLGGSLLYGLFGINRYQRRARRLFPGADPAVRQDLTPTMPQTVSAPFAGLAHLVGRATGQSLTSGKIDNAKAELARALNTLVVTSVAFPLTVLRAEAAIAKAEKLAETDKRDAKQNEELSTLLSSVCTEIEMAQILGYGKKADFKPIFDQVKFIEQKSAGGKSGKGWFDELKTRIQKLF